MFYDNLRKVCKARNTTPTTILKELGMSTGNTGKWKNGGVPSVDVAYKIAKLLDVSVEFLLVGEETHTNDVFIDPEWVEIISHIPDDKQDMCKDFLRTHMVIPEKYADRKRA